MLCFAKIGTPCLISPWVIQMAYCGVHFRKLKTAAHIQKSCSHDRRSHTPKNTTPSRFSENITLLDHGRDRWEIINEKISQRVKRKVRDNAVRMIEAFVYSSPEYFRPTSPSRTGTWEENRLRPWVDSVYKWLVKEHGLENLLEVHVHLDEATPHIHAVILPITDDGRLTAKEYLMNRVQLRNAQTSLSKSLAHLGLNRGLKSSGAKHISADKWNAEIQKCLITRTKTPKPEPAGSLPLVPAKKYKKLEKDYKKAVAALRRAEKRATHAQTLVAENKQLKKINAGYAKELELLRPIAKQVRGVDMRQVLRDHPNGKNAQIKNGHAYAGAGYGLQIGRNAIDLVMSLSNCEYKKAVAWLAERYNDDALVSTILYSQRASAKRAAEEIVKEEERKKKFELEQQKRSRNQRQYYILYKHNVEKELIEDFDVWENNNGKFLKHSSNGYHIWDKGDCLILRKADSKDFSQAISLMLEIAVDKGWVLNQCIAFGSDDFKEEFKSQVVARQKEDKPAPQNKPKPRP